MDIDPLEAWIQRRTKAAFSEFSGVIFEWDEEDALFVSQLLGVAKRMAPNFVHVGRVPLGASIVKVVTARKISDRKPVEHYLPDFGEWCLDMENKTLAAGHEMTRATKVKTWISPKLQRLTSFFRGRASD